MGRKKMMYLAAVLVIAGITAAFTLLAHGSDADKCAEFLRGYGWEVENRAIETADVIIPEPFDLVYENYNKLQLEAGLDLRPYMGCEGVRYTYVVTNYPACVGSEVRANVICVGGVPVAGDIMTVDINGFMKSLNFGE